MLNPKLIQVIMDEVGRGTTVQDGLAIAFATLEHLYTKNKCRALFATHFHEVADILGYVDPSTVGTVSVPSEKKIFEHVGFFCTDVCETDVSYIRALVSHLNETTGWPFCVLAPITPRRQPRQSRSQSRRSRWNAWPCHQRRIWCIELAEKSSWALGR